MRHSRTGLLLAMCVQGLSRGLCRLAKVTIAVASLVAVATTLPIGLTAAQPVLVLITPEEARLPASQVVADVRGITRRPTIVLVTPDGPTSSPTRVQIRFQAFGAAAIDGSSVRVTYVRYPEIDITNRLQPYMTAAGIDVPLAVIPAGDHTLRVELKDAEGRTATSNLVLKVSP